MEESSPLYKLYMDTAYVRENPPPKKFAEHKVQYLHFWYLKELSNTKPTIWEMILEIEISRVEGGEYLENGYQKVDVVFLCVWNSRLPRLAIKLEDSLVACFLGPPRASPISHFDPPRIAKRVPSVVIRPSPQMSSIAPDDFRGGYLDGGRLNFLEYGQKWNM